MKLALQTLNSSFGRGAIFETVSWLQARGVRLCLVSGTLCVSVCVRVYL
jgi:hypothetical protein